MRTGHQEVIRVVRRLAYSQDESDRTDRELLERFLAQRDEAAFEALVRRYGRMVFGVYRRILHNTADAEDAFQATFLVLVRRADSVLQRDLLGNWLYGVACRIALTARAGAERRRKKEARAVQREQSVGEPEYRELQAILDQQISSLPDKYRIPLVMCFLEGIVSSIPDEANPGGPQNLECPLFINTHVWHNSHLQL